MSTILDSTPEEPYLVISTEPVDPARPLVTAFGPSPDFIREWVDFQVAIIGVALGVSVERRNDSPTDS